jgi:hypothetical protein
MNCCCGTMPQLQKKKYIKIRHIHRNKNKQRTQICSQSGRKELERHG